MNEYEVEWESSHSTIVKANNSAEAMEIAKEMTDIEASFVAITDGPFVTEMWCRRDNDTRRKDRIH